MSEHNLSSLKPLSPDKEVGWRPLWHRVLGPKSPSHSPFSEAASPCVVLGPLLWPVLGHSWDLDTFVSFLNPSLLKGRNLFVEVCAQIRLGRIFKEIAP